MKKTVFAAVILLIIAGLFASCGWDIRIIDPREIISNIESNFSSEKSEPSSESESAPEETQTSESESRPETEKTDPAKIYRAKSVLMEDAEEFMLTEEAFDDIKLFVSYLGNVSFEKTRSIIGSDVTEVLSWFKEEIYEAAGEPKDAGHYFSVEKSLGDKIIKKYLGIDYKIAEGTKGYDTETGKYTVETPVSEGFTGENKFLSCEAEMLGGNRVKCRILMIGAKDSIGENFVISEMVFDVMEDDDGKFLRLVSNKVIEKFREASFENQAKSLTEQIVEQMGKIGFKEGIREISSERAFNFICRMQMRINLGTYFDKKAPYIGQFYRDDEGYHFTTEAMRKIALEVFGIQNFNMNSQEGFTYNKEEKEFVSGLEWGMETNATAENMETYISGNTYIVSFDLVTLENVDGNPEWVTGGKYKMTFELTEGKYLRFSGFDRA